MNENELKLGACFCVIEELVHFLTPEQRRHLHDRLELRVLAMKNDPNSSPVEVQAFVNYLKLLG